MDPGEMAIAVGKRVELCLLAIPENSQGHEAQHVADQLGRGFRQGVPKLPLAVNQLARRHMEIQYQQRHGYGEEAVTEGREPLQASTGNLVVRRRHFRVSNLMKTNAAKPAVKLG